MTTIRSVVAVAVDYPFARYFGGAEHVPATVSSPSSHFQHIKRSGQAATFVCVTDSDGSFGLGECFGLPSPKLSATLINDLIGPSLVGRAIEPPAQQLKEWQTYFAALGHTRGAAMEALSGLDIALWDLAARSAGQSLSSLLGGSLPAIETYASPIPFTDHPDRSIEAAQTLLDLGFTSLKMKIGRDPAADLEHIRAVREFLPATSQLMLDANCAYSLAQAKTLLDGMAGLDIAWLEEPLPLSLLDELRCLAQHSSIPVAAGENEFTVDAFKALVVRGDVRILQPNITRAGGVSGCLAIDDLARQHGAAVSPHGVGAAVATAALLHTCSALRTCAIVEANRLLNPLRDDLGIHFLPDPDGKLCLPHGPGHGSVPDWQTIADLVSAADLAKLISATTRR